MSVETRRRQVRINHYCQNCLARSHVTEECTSNDVCQKCGWAHHTLLHQPTRVSTYSSHSREGSTDVERNTHQGSHGPRRPVRDRLGPYRRPTRQQSASAEPSQPRNHPRRTSNGPASNAKRLLMGALRTLEWLAQTI